MNREILFRGKRVDNGKWAYGYYVNCSGPGCKPNETRHYIVEYPNVWHEFYTPTHGEYTGLKDRNGKRIFEGDILREPPKNDWEKKNYVAYEIFWHDNDSCDRHIGWQMNRLHFFGALCGADIYPISFRPEWTNRMEIIGNIHDNPELWEVRNDGCS